ncbi:lipid-binding protein [Flavobacterium notoginsengisoli]|uniref:lipid-binding protein n=1 Tax=Flavobacterium notoginsengisoli TaxID=1478199 RepID=UPI0036D31DAB
MLVLMSFVACDEVGDTDPGGTSTEAMAGDWYVQTLVNGVVVVDYKLLSTYNTAANNGKEFWIDDHGNVWDFKVKAPLTLSALSFAGNNLASSVDDYDVNVNITEGKITKNGATSTGGHKVDGISFKAQFSDDPTPGTIYEIKGYKRTGFPEDEH